MQDLPQNQEEKVARNLEIKKIFLSSLLIVGLGLGIGIGIGLFISVPAKSSHPPQQSYTENLSLRVKQDPSATQPTLSATQPAPSVTQPAPSATQPAPPVTQPASPVTQPASPVTQPAPSVAQPASPVTQPAPSVAQPAPSVAQPAPSNFVKMIYKIPITYVWLGRQLPSRYKKRLDWITFPYILLGESDWLQWGKEYLHFNLTDVRRSDILRLLYLKHNGGIYSDIDNIIDYPCLMERLAEKKGFYIIGGQYAKWGQGNAFMYSDRAQDQEVNKILEQIKVRLPTMTPQDIVDPLQTGRLTGPYILDDYHIRKMDDILICVQHEADVTWSKGFELRPKK